MPTALTYPGVYIEEVPSGVRTITGVATSITAFVGRALRGEALKPVRIQSFADYERAFGGLWEDSTMSYAVQQYFLNDGVDALIVRVVPADALGATITLTAGAGELVLVSANAGAWGGRLRVSVDHDTRDPQVDDEFNLVITELDPVKDDVVQFKETFRNLSSLPTSPRFVTSVLAQQSQLVRVDGNVGERPDEVTDAKHPIPPDPQPANGGVIDDVGLVEGINALDQADLFNLLCIPPITRETDIDPSTRDAAAAYCAKRRAMFIADPPLAWNTVAAAETGVNTFMTRSKNAAAYFPRVKVADPLHENRLEEFAPCGMIAGIYARTDNTRGVWKAPAGTDAVMRGVRELSVKMTDLQNGQLNPLGLNGLRTFPVHGQVVWGARTLDGADAQASEWKYIPVRRLALFLEESLYRGTQWVVFEPNDEPLWSQIRLNLGAFMHNLFRQGAFQGSSPREAYFVKCDKETTTQNDINLGIVNIVVGFAPLKPAEFVVIRIQQMAGQLAV
jgi:phage tail sheath protein FI